MPLMPQFVKFYVGEDARGSRAGGPATGELFQADLLVPHPDYDPNDPGIGSDIGLVRLKTEVKGVEPLVINSSALQGDNLDDQVLYVGFGISDGIKETGSGVKRSTHMPITWIENDSYYTVPQGSGTCSGDSGGPGILETTPGDWKVVGIVSAGTDLPGEEDPCLVGYGIYTRVDAYASWIAEVTGIELPDCAENDLCFCAKACGPDFGCDNTVCFEMSCARALQCVSRCAPGDAGCSLDCRMGVVQESQVDFDVIAYCLDKHCSGAEDSLDCAMQQCYKGLETCLADASGDADCASYDECVIGCLEADTLCMHVCDLEADPAAKEARGIAADCLVELCGTGTDEESIASQCAMTQCREEVDACFPFPECDLLGGSCPEGMACVPAEDGGGICAESGGLGPGASCSPSETAPCADGLTCIGEGADAACRRLCVNDDPCDEGEICLAGAGDLGWCGCYGDSCGGQEAGDSASLPDSSTGTSGSGCSAGRGPVVPWAFLILATVVLVRRKTLSQMEVTK